jgi:hypothetical protein
MDRDALRLLPPDIRCRVAKNHPVRFVIDAVNAADTGLAVVNERGERTAKSESSSTFSARNSTPISQSIHGLDYTSQTIGVE